MYLLMKYAERDLVTATLAIASIERRMTNGETLYPEKIWYYNQMIKSLPKLRKTLKRRAKQVDKMTTTEIQMEIENNSNSLRQIDEAIAFNKRYYSQQPTTGQQQ